MKVWELDVPAKSEYATLYPHYIGKETGTCSACGSRQGEDPPYMSVEWELGSDQIGDFTCAYGLIVVKSSVADELLEHFSGFEKGRVEMPDAPALRKPKRITKRTRKCVWLPYEGPELCELKITRDVEFHPSSTVTVESDCPKCGRIYKEFKGIEKKNLKEHIPRTPGEGFFFRKSDLKGDDFFRPKYTGFILCTQPAADFIREKGYTNIELLEVGDLIDE